MATPPIQSPTSYGYKFGSHLSTSEQPITENTDAIDNSLSYFDFDQSQLLSVFDTNLSNREVVETEGEITSYVTDPSGLKLGEPFSFSANFFSGFPDVLLDYPLDDNSKKPNSWNNEHDDNFLNNLANSTTNSSSHPQNTELSAQSDDNSEKPDGDWAYCYDFGDLKKVSDEGIEATKSGETAKRSISSIPECQPSTSKKPKILATDSSKEIPVTTIEISEAKQKTISVAAQEYITKKNPSVALAYLYSFLRGAGQQRIRKDAAKIQDEYLSPIFEMLCTTKTAITVGDVLYAKINSATRSNITTLNNMSLDDLFDYTPKTEIITYRHYKVYIATNNIPNYMNLFMTAIYCYQQNMPVDQFTKIISSTFQTESNATILTLRTNIKQLLTLDILHLFLLHNYFILSGKLRSLTKIDHIKFSFALRMEMIQTCTWLLAGTEELFSDYYSNFFKTLNKRYADFIKEHKPKIPNSAIKHIFIDTANKDRILIRDVTPTPNLNDGLPRSENSARWLPR